MLNDFRLKVFYTCAIKGNFTRAAKELGITQPAVSSHIAEIENDIHDLLFIRKRGEVILTPKGKILFDYAEKILHLYAAAYRELVPTLTEKRKNLKIAAPGLIAQKILPQLVEFYSKGNPSANIVIIEKEDAEMEELLNDEEIDLAFTFSPAGVRESKLFARFTVNGSINPMVSVYCVYDSENKKKELIEKFILSCQTFR